MYPKSTATPSLLAWALAGYVLAPKRDTQSMIQSVGSVEGGGDNSDFVAHLHYEIFSLSLVTLTFCCLPLDWCASFDRVEFKPVPPPFPLYGSSALRDCWLSASIVRLEFHIGVVAHGFFIMINIFALIRRQSQSVSSSLVLPLPFPLPHLLLICSLVWCESFHKLLQLQLLPQMK